MRLNTVSALAPALALLLAALCPAAELAIGQAVSGELTEGDATAPGGQFQDEWTVAVAAGQALAIAVSSEAFDTVLAVTAPGGETYENDDSGGTLNSRVALPPPAEAGVATVRVRSAERGGTGRYTLAASPITVQTIDAGQTIQATLTGPQALFTLGVAAGQTLIIDAKSAAFDMTLGLQGPDGARLFNDDTDGLDSRLVYTAAQTGTATLVVAPYETGSGDFTLSVQALAPFATLTWQPGTTATTRLGLRGGPRVLGLRGPAGERVIIDAMSDEFDTVLTVVTTADSQVRTNDDGGGGTNSRVALTLPAEGQVFLLVSSYEVGQGGRFEVRIGGAPPPMAPRFALSDLEGRCVSSAQFDGKVRIIDFWATWCPPCRAEIPHFNEIAREFGGRGVEVIGISVDRSLETGGPDLAAVRQFVEETPVEYTMLMDDGSASEAYGALTEEGAILHIPTTFVVGRDGRVAAVFTGYRSKEIFVAEIERLLGD